MSEQSSSALRRQHARWLRIARRHAGAGEADDLLQEALLVAFEAGRQPLLDDQHEAWFHGVLRKLAAFRVRSAVRRRGREEAAVADPTAERVDAADHGVSVDEAVTAVRTTLMAIPPSQRSLLVLILHGLDRAEIRQVLGIADTALRQRLAGLRKRLADASLGATQEPFQAWLAVRNGAEVGLKRAALARGPARIAGFRMGMSDPDGHLLGIHVPRRSGQ